jgi:hypothetical protein
MRFTRSERRGIDTKPIYDFSNDIATSRGGREQRHAVPFCEPVAVHCHNTKDAECAFNLRGSHTCHS